MLIHPDIGLQQTCCNLHISGCVYSNIIIINVCECCVNNIQMLMHWTAITAINILTMCAVMYLIILMVQLYSMLPTA